MIISFGYRMESLFDDLLLCIFTVGLVDLGELWLPVLKMTITLIVAGLADHTGGQALETPGELW